ncbi:MAG: hypothetical protein KGL92_11640, partial [Gammaproteobacteria bacterium]|nr:hypothetical protein [Gammaproteobacteria bacterium]
MTLARGRFPSLARFSLRRRSRLGPHGGRGAAGRRRELALRLLPRRRCELALRLLPRRRRELALRLLPRRRRELALRLLPR